MATNKSEYKPTKNQKELLNLLGPEYSIKVIDLEPCIYRKINENYDIEISGTLKKSQSIYVYVWDISRGIGNAACIVETVDNIKSHLHLKNIVEDLTKKYLDL